MILNGTCTPTNFVRIPSCCETDPLGNTKSMIKQRDDGKIHGGKRKCMCPHNMCVSGKEACVLQHLFWWFRWPKSSSIGVLKPRNFTVHTAPSSGCGVRQKGPKGKVQRFQSQTHCYFVPRTRKYQGFFLTAQPITPADSPVQTASRQS